MACMERDATTTKKTKMGKGSIADRLSPAGAAARLLCIAVFTTIILAGIIALSLYLVYRPSKPRFTVLGASIYQLSNSTSPPTPATAVATSMQFTVAIRNPSQRASIRYDRLSAYVAYRGETITPAMPLPDVFQERDSTVVVSPVLGGTCVPVSPEAAAGLMMDEAYGVVGLRLVVLGRVRYKTGPFKSGWNGMYVRCDMLLGIKKGVSGQVQMIGSPDCSVEV